MSGRQLMFTPYLGFGGRYWVRELGSGTAGVYEESYSHYYLALGTKVQYSPQELWVLSADASLGRTFYPSIYAPKVGLSNVPLGPGPILKIGLEADSRVKGPLHLFAGFEYMYFNYGQSAIQSLGNGFGVMEPFSHTEVYTVKAGVRVHFDELELLNFR